MKMSSKKPMMPNTASGRMSNGEMRYRNAASTRIPIRNLNIHMRPPTLKNSWNA